MEARRKGQVARSADLVSAVGFAAAFGLLASGLPELGIHLREAVQAGLSGRALVESPEAAAAAGSSLLLFVGREVAPLMLATIVASTVAQVAYTQGPVWHASAVSPDLNRMNPLEAVKRWFSMKMAVEAFKMAVKTAVFGSLSWGFWKNDLLPMIHGASGTGWLADAALAIAGFGWRFVVAMIVVGILDGAYQFWEHLRGLRMSLYEIKQEYKQQEGDPYRKAELKARMRKLVKSRSLSGVKKSNVVVTNPTHLSVAVRYKMGEGAPRVVAKGGDHLALRIRQLARKHRIPIVPNAPVARALYNVEVDQEIPPPLYRAIAEILVSVTRLEDLK